MNPLCIKPIQLQQALQLNHQLKHGAEIHCLQRQTDASNTNNAASIIVLFMGFTELFSNHLHSWNSLDYRPFAIFFIISARHCNIQENDQTMTTIRCQELLVYGQVFLNRYIQPLRATFLPFCGVPRCSLSFFSTLCTTSWACVDFSTGVGGCGIGWGVGSCCWRV